MNKFFTTILAGAAFAALVFLSCTKEEKDAWDNGTYNIGGGYTDSSPLKFALKMRGAVLDNGTLEKNFQGISGWSINVKWLEEYVGGAQNLVVETTGNIPQEILSACESGTITTVNLLIRSSEKYEQEGATPISDFRNARGARGANITQEDVNILTAKFQDKLGSCVNVVANTDDVNIVGGFPEINSDIEQRPNDGPNAGKMFFQFNNKTGGQYSDDQIYIVIIGLMPHSGQWQYVDKNGVMHRITESLNNMNFDAGRVAADLSFKLSDGLGAVPNAKYLYMPDIESGRMFISYGNPVYIQCFDNGFGGPDVNNATDPNVNTYFEFIEFTIEGQYHGNTTRVDFFSFPIVTSLYGADGIKTVGEIGTREQIYAAWQSEVPNEFKSLSEPLRILAPCKRTFNEGQPNARYFDAYIDELWNKWKTDEAVFNCGDAGIIRGRVGEDNVLKMVRDGHIGNPDWGDIRIRKPNTQEVLEGKGALDDGSQGSRVGSLAIQAQVCAAINRGVAHSDEWEDASRYYKTGKPANHYSKFWHDHSIGGRAYGFCYDDVFDHATLLYDPQPIALVIDLKW